MLTSKNNCLPQRYIGAVPSQWLHPALIGGQNGRKLREIVTQTERTLDFTIYWLPRVLKHAVNHVFYEVLSTSKHWNTPRITYFTRFWAELSKTELCKTELCKTELCKSELCKTEFCKTELCKTELCKTELCKTELCKTELCKTELCKTQLCNTVLCKSEICKSGGGRTEDGWKEGRGALSKN
jgi:hypothetical protein